MYNCVTTALRDDAVQHTDIWKISEASRFQSLFNPYQKQYEQRLQYQLSLPRVSALPANETAQKCFVLQKLEDASIFLDSDIARYKALNLNYSNNSSPSSREDLLKFQELILLDIRFLAGCDINWDHRNETPKASDTATADKFPADKSPAVKPAAAKPAAAKSIKPAAAKSIKAAKAPA
jgi:hypothetical protein